MLEAREVPATLTWTGAYAYPYSWFAQNWQTAPGVPAISPPAPGDDLVFDGSVSSAGCYGLRGFGLPETQADFNSVRFVNGYNGTVQVASDGTAGLAVNTFDMSCGVINQQSTGADLGVLTSFSWTGGTLNGNPGGAANVNVLGSGSITRPAGGTLNCGSTLNFSNPSAAAVQTVIAGAGTLLLTGGNGITVEADAKVTVVVRFNAGGALKGLNTATKTLTLMPGAVWGYSGKGTEEEDFRVINHGGQFVLGISQPDMGEVTLKLLGGDAATPAYTQSRLPFSIVEPTLWIVNGSTLEASKGVVINSGFLTSAGNPNVPAAGQQTTIKGDLTVNGGNIGFYQSPVQAGQFLVWTTFYVEGNVVWSGGTYYPGVDGRPGETTFCNQWKISGTLTIPQSSTPKIEPVLQLVPQGNPPPFGRIWYVISATGGVQGDPGIAQGWNLLPNINSDGVKKGFYVTLGGP